jgi:hypothetical protein
VLGEHPFRGVVLLVVTMVAMSGPQQSMPKACAVQHQTRRSLTAWDAHSWLWWGLHLSASAGPVCCIWKLLAAHAVAVLVV